MQGTCFADLSRKFLAEVWEGEGGKEINVAFAVLWHNHSNIQIRECTEHGYP